MDSRKPPTTSPPATAARVTADELIESREILKGNRCATIEHKGVCYRLQETRAGKLILTK